VIGEDRRIRAARALLRQRLGARSMGAPELRALLATHRSALRRLVELFTELPWIDDPEPESVRLRLEAELLAGVPRSQRAEPEPDDGLDLAGATARILAAIPGDTSEVVTWWLRDARAEAAGAALDDLPSVLAALDTAAECLEYRASLSCSDCAGHPAELCEDHAGLLERATAYRALSARLGGDR
jgi:ATP-dependent helicase YprA (DUF1998 family)